MRGKIEGEKGGVREREGKETANGKEREMKGKGGEERRMGREVREGEGKGEEEKRKGKGKMRQRIEYKLAVLVYRCLHGLAPPYLASDLQRVADLDDRRRLRSSVDRRAQRAFLAFVHCW